MREKRQPIPSRVFNATQGGHVCGVEDVVDDKLNMTQEQINTKTDIEIYGAGSGLRDRIHALEEAASVVIDGEDRDIANTPEEIQPGSGKIPTSNAVGGMMNLQHNEDWIYVVIDKALSVLGGMKSDGTVEWAKGVPTPIKKYIEVRVSQIIDSWDQAHYQNSRDFIYAITDLNGRVVVTIQKDGGLFVAKSLNLSEQAMTDFQKALKDAGFRPGGQGDYSDTITKKGKSPVCIEMPRLALLNLITEPGLNLSGLSKSDRPDGVQKINYDVAVEVEFCDGKGVGFTKKAVIGAQGNSSMIFPKKNISLKIFDTTIENNKGKWAKGDTFGICFGDWVMQKSWHLKSYYTDFIRGSSVIAYQLANEVALTYGEVKDRPWKKALIPTLENPYPSAEFDVDNMAIQMDNGARCQPDGFPVLVFQNGKFYGVYSWQIKKDVDNYNLDETNAQNVHLDGDLYDNTLWGGNIDWTAFEIRCPEGLKTVTGADYNGDHPTEISGTDEFSAQVKGYITALAGYTAAIRAAMTTSSILIGDYKGIYDSTKTYAQGEWVFSGSDRYMSLVASNTGNAITDTSKWKNINSVIASAKALVEQYFDIDSMVDYQVVNMAVDDPDGFGKNWQWITYDGVKWYVCEYDKDMAFGNHASGMFTRKPGTGWEHNNPRTPMGLVTRLYGDVMVKRWVELRELGLFTTEHIENLLVDWMSQIGQKNFEQEWNKWNEAPCNRNNEINSNWEYGFNYTSTTEWLASTIYSYGMVVVYNGVIYKSQHNNNRGNVPGTDDNWLNISWNSEQSYSIGDEAWMQTIAPNFCVAFISTTNNNIGNQPIPTTPPYSEVPRFLGYRDSVWRYFKFIEDNLSNRNEFINSLL